MSWAPGQFEQTWRARWIWAEAPPVSLEARLVPRAIPPKETRNRFCFLRRGFSLDAVPAAVPARVTADSRFVLWVNGTEVARGPARSVPERLAWEEIDLAPWLGPGRNAVCALVRFYGLPAPWWIPAAPSAILGYGSFAFEAPAIGVSSDASWRGRPAPYEQHTRIPGALVSVPPEHVDGAQWPRGWTEAGFDDADWAPACELWPGPLAANRDVLPVEPYTAPEPSRIAPLTAIDVPLDARAEGVYDAGRITLATPWIEMRGPQGSSVEVIVGEDLRDDGTIETRPRGYSLRYTLAGDGDERIDGFEAVGFRYLGVSASDASVVRVGATERRYPRTGDAFFACGDERLNAIWEMGARTLDVCSTDAFLDCPGREQRAWLGDSYVHTLVTFVTNEDWRLVRRHLRICAHSRKADGLLPMVAAGDFSTVSVNIPDYSLHWLRALARYHEHSGDTETAEELLPAAQEIVRFFERCRGADGLLHTVPGWVFVDWAQTERAEVVGALDALYAAALDDLAALSGDGRYRALADRTREAFDALWDEERGVYVDALDGAGRRRRVSQQTNAVAIVSGCALSSRQGRILDRILDPARVVVTVTPGDAPIHQGHFAQWEPPSAYVAFDEDENVVAAQPFFSHFLHQAVVTAGRRYLIPDLCMRWWAQIERGNTTFEEYWDAPPGTSSRAHAWSATPTYDLTTHVLGVRPLSPGYTRAEIDPFDDDVRGRVPTPHGPIEVDLPGGTIVVPDGVTAVFRGRELGAGRHRVERDQLGR